MHKDTRAILTTHVNQMETDTCPSGEVFLLTKSLGLDQSVNEFVRPERLDVNVYNQLAGQLQRDVDQFNSLIFSFRFVDRLMMVLGFSSNIKTIHDKAKKDHFFLPKN